MHVYRWDLDKTYLETDFDSVRGLLRSAYEKAHEKRNVPGALSLMRQLADKETSRVAIVSGSPTQLRKTLEAKLELDGIRFSSLTLKDSFGQLRKRRFRSIRGQFGYKLPILLEARVGLGAGVRETLFGDDAEVDALVYSVYADAISGRLAHTDLARILELSGAYADEVEAALDALARVGIADAVDDIFIRLERGRPQAEFAPLGRRVVPIHSWWQAALVLVARGRLEPFEGARVLEEVMVAGETPFGVASLFQDAVRRSLVPRGFEGLLGPSDLVDACHRAAERSGPTREPPAVPGPPDYLALLERPRG